MRKSDREVTTVPTVGTPSLDQVFDLLSERRRRYVLYYLRDVEDGVASVEEVTEYVLRLENDLDISGVARSIDTALHHVHLPKLADSGVLEYDTRSETIRYWGQPSLDEWLEHAFHKEL